MARLHSAIRLSPKFRSQHTSPVKSAALLGAGHNRAPAGASRTQAIAGAATAGGFRAVHSHILPLKLAV